MLSFLPKRFRRSDSFSSKGYWDGRYKNGGDSGEGSYGHLAEFKATNVNRIIEQNQISSVIEFGCGDGNNLRYYKIPHYIGVDVSETAVALCSDKFAHEKTSKTFVGFDDASDLRAEMTMSLDVIFHLVEDQAYYSYLDKLFCCAFKHVLIYSSDFNARTNSPHVRHRAFTSDVASLFPAWKIVEVIPNAYPSPDIAAYTPGTSHANFYLYSKMTSVA